MKTVMTKTVMVSDLHMVGRDDPVQHQFVRWMERLDADVVVLLGDIFHHWWGFQDRVQDRYRPACDALLAAHGRGVRFVYVPGNHDFAVGGFFRHTLGACIRGPHIRQIDGIRLFLAHGDEADGSFGYRVTRGLLRGRGFAALMQGLGPERGDRLVVKLAGGSRAHPADIDRLLLAQREWAREHLRAGADVAVLGHLHQPGLLDYPEGQVVHLGDWSRGPVWLEVTGGGLQLLRESDDGIDEFTSVSGS